MSHVTAAPLKNIKNVACGTKKNEGSRRNYPKAPPIPDSDAETDAIVDDWWEKFEQLYFELDLTNSLAAIYAFWDEHPDKVKYL